MESQDQAFWTDLSANSHSSLGQANEHQQISRERLPLEEGLQWGSDPNFGYHGYNSPIGTWTEERLVQNLMRNIASFYTSVDIGFNEPQSIDENQPKPYLDPIQLNGLTLPMFEPSMVPTNERTFESPSSASSPISSSSSQTQKRESASDNTECTRRPSCIKATNKSGQKKRKCVQKPGQKLCHCQSEKKRREIVAERYTQLCRLVPGLEKHSYTRKYVLMEAAQWIQKLLQDNEALRQQLNRLKEQEEWSKVRSFPI